VLPSGLTTFVDEVIPLLQARGLFRTEYSGATLRDHYGLARPGDLLVPEFSHGEKAAIGGGASRS
jgi:hypothetical protein